MKETTQSKQPRLPSLAESIGIITIAIVIIVIGIRMGRGVSAMYMPLILDIALIVAFGMYLGHSFKSMQDGLVKATGKVMVPVLILLMIGAVIGLWITSGTIPTIIYFGLKLVSPSFFLGAAFITTCIMALATGTSWGTIGSAGVAMMGIGTALGVSAPLTAGAVISGALFGDKMSPLSDTTNMTVAVTNVDLFDHVRSALWTTVPAAVVVAIAFWIVGARATGSADMGQVQEMLTGLSTGWHISPLHLLPILLFFVGAKIPSLIIIFINVLVGMFWSLIFQGASLMTIFDSATNGFVSQTGVQMVDTVLTNGGMLKMLQVIILLLCATGFGGILDATGVLGVIVNATVNRVKSVFGLVTSTIVTSYILVFLTGNQAMPIIMPGIAFSPVFNERRISRTVLSRTIGDSGTISVPLVPWGAMAGFITATLGVTHAQYWPFLWLTFTVPIFALIFAATGIAIWKVQDNDAINKKEDNDVAAIS